MERIGMPVAMGNGRPEAIAAARFVAGDFAEEGAAVFLEEVLRRIRGAGRAAPRHRAARRGRHGAVDPPLLR
jgi:hypothetical protein